MQTITKMNRHNNKTAAQLAITAATALAMVACASHGGDAVSISPKAHNVQPDSLGNVSVQTTFRVPEAYLTRRSRLIIQPQLIAADTLVKELRPMVLDRPIYAKKQRRRTALGGYDDPYARFAVSTQAEGDTISVPFSSCFALPEGIDGNARVVAFLTIDGCNTCENADTMLVAEISNPVTLADKELHLEWIEPDFVVKPKVATGRGEARLQFVINKSDIRLDMGNNRAELDTMEARLRPVVTDTLATLNSLDIFGMASADGPYALNTGLARRRATSARNWVVRRLAMTPAQQRVIKTGSRPEGWLPVLQAMIADGHPDTAAVRKIINTHPGTNDDPQERLIRRLKCWPDIRSRYLQKDRKVEYTYTYTLRNFTTDDELLAMYSRRPDAFNENELLRVAAIMPDTASKQGVYETLVKYFPQSTVAANNLAVLALRRGDTDKAEAILAVPGTFSPEMTSALAAAYVYRGDFERAVELLADVEDPQARYNLGLLKARQRKIGEAYELLRPFADTNSAIMALSTNRNGEADAIMQKCTDSSPRADYVRALIAARLGRAAEARTYIKAASADEGLRRRAATEPDFKALIAPTAYTNANK